MNLVFIGNEIPFKHTNARRFGNKYNKGTREGENDIFKLAKIRERKSGNLDYVKCIKSDGQKVLAKENDIKERWREYFNKISNEDPI